MTPWSVSPRAGWPKAAARAARASILHAPSRSEYSEWTCRWAQAGLLKARPMLGAPPDGWTWRSAELAGFGDQSRSGMPWRRSVHRRSWAKQDASPLTVAPSPCGGASRARSGGRAWRGAVTGAPRGRREPREEREEGLAGDDDRGVRAAAGRRVIDDRDGRAVGDDDAVDPRPRRGVLDATVDGEALPGPPVAFDRGRGRREDEPRLDRDVE